MSAAHQPIPSYSPCARVPTVVYFFITTSAIAEDVGFGGLRVEGQGVAVIGSGSSYRFLPFVFGLPLLLDFFLPPPLFLFFRFICLRNLVTSNFARFPPP